MAQRRELLGGELPGPQMWRPLLLLMVLLARRGGCPAAPPTGDSCRPTAGETCEEARSPSLPAAGLQAADLAGSSGCCAYVMLAVGHGDFRGKIALWQSLPIAWALRRFQSRYPLILLTDIEKFPDGKRTDEELSKLGIQVRRAQQVPIPETLAKTFRYDYWKRAWAKLQVFNLTEFQKIIWMDSDAIVTRNMDALFKRPGSGPWMMRDTWDCQMKTQQPCSGLMLIEPSTRTYEGLLTYAGSLKKLISADQELISRYFRDVAKTKPKLFEHLDASFGHCLGMVPGINDTNIQAKWKFESPWRLPAFVHKSNTGNECFHYDVRHQIKELGGGVRGNVCHFNILGTYWRDAFCSAVRFLNTSTKRISSFCDDALWYAPLA